MEHSLPQYYFQNKQHFVYTESVPIVHPNNDITDEERGLRLLVGILGSDITHITKQKLIKALVCESLLTTKSPKTETDLKLYLGKTLSVPEHKLETDISKAIKSLASDNKITKMEDGKFQLSPNQEDTFRDLCEKSNTAEKQMFEALYKCQKEILPQTDVTEYISIIRHAISQVIYDTAFSMVEVEFSGDKNPIPYDADELHRLVCEALTQLGSLPGGLGDWQRAVVEILKSTDPKIIAWLNRIRKAYWLLATFGCNPDAIDYQKKHFMTYCVYLDSHIIIRAMVRAGGESVMCRKIIELGRSNGVCMRISYAMFHEVENSFTGANKVYFASNKDIGRAVTFYKNLNRKFDIFDGFLDAASRNNSLSWESYINQFYSPADPNKLKNYIEKELGVEVRADIDFLPELLERIEEMSKLLLEKRCIKQPDGMNGEQHLEWERQYTLRSNEARQMAIIYKLRRQPDKDRMQYWFVTFDNLVYDVSIEMVKSGNPFYVFPCYMKPARWLEILVNASYEQLNINVFREILLSPAISYAADYIESEVIAQMLKNRIDKDIRDIETLRNMFRDIVNRPAIQDAYEEMLKADGVAALAAEDKLKDQVINVLKEETQHLQNELAKKSEQVSMAERIANKAKGREKYYRKQFRRFQLFLKSRRKRGR